MATKTEAGEPSPSCTLTCDGVSLVLYGVSRGDVLDDPLIAVRAFGRHGVGVESDGDVRVQAGVRVLAGLPPTWRWPKRGAAVEHFCLNGRGAR